ncbi:MAG: beta-ketoacyl synthase N-terminal-like domain-containing protein, partial [bacterium]
MNDVRVVVTGIGVISPIGNTKDEFWQSLQEGKSGIGPITHFDASLHDAKIAGEIKGFDPLLYLDKKEAKRMDHFAQYAVAAAKMALKDADFEINEENCDDVGVYVASGIGGLETLEAQHKVLLEKGPKRISPFVIPMMIVNMASGQVSIVTGAKGPNTTVVTACASSTNSIGDAYKLIQRGAAKAMIAGGTEATITPLAVAGFASMKALSTRNAEPERASRPFDAERDGFI